MLTAVPSSAGHVILTKGGTSPSNATSHCRYPSLHTPPLKLPSRPPGDISSSHVLDFTSAAAVARSWAVLPLPMRLAAEGQPAFPVLLPQPPQRRLYTVVNPVSHAQWHNCHRQKEGMRDGLSAAMPGTASTAGHHEGQENRTALLKRVQSLMPAQDGQVS